MCFAVVGQALLSLGLSIVPSPPDGHCLLHSLHAAWKYQLSTSSAPSLSAIIEGAFTETITYSDNYIPKMEPPTSEALFHEMHVYLFNRHYNNRYADQMPLILANTFRLTLEIFDEQMVSGHVPCVISPDHTEPIATLRLHKDGEHYNALAHSCLPKNQPANCQQNYETCLAEKTYPDNKSDGTCKYRYTRQELMDINISAHLPRSTRKRLFHLHLWNPLDSSSISRRGVNHHNLVHVTHKDPQKTSFDRRLTFGVWNARSVRNKTVPFMEYVNDKQLDIVGITETWLSTKDSAVIGALTQKEYKFLHMPRGHTSGGGVGLLYKESLQVELRSSEDSYRSFESLEVKVTAATACFILVIVYRTCPSSKNKLTSALFLQEFTDFLDNFVISFDKVVIAGDFNYHVDSSDSDAQKFISLLDNYSFTQLVKGPTHNKGHTLDLVISRSNDNFVFVQHVDDISLSDHHFIMCHLEVPKPRSLPTTKTFRRFKALDREKFANDLLTTEITEPKSQSLDELNAKYNTTLSDLLDEHAPLVTRTVPPATCPWYDNGIRQAKRLQRKYERTWRRTRLTVHGQMYVDQRKAVCDMITKNKKLFFTRKVSDTVGDSKGFFHLVDQLLHRNRVSSLPNCPSSDELAVKFNEFFLRKVADIRENLLTKSICQEMVVSNCNEQVCLSSFQIPSTEEIETVLKASKSKTSCLDPAPSGIVKQCVKLLGPVILDIVKRSLETGVFPSDFKVASVTPVLKKSNLDNNILKNYRPISNLHFVSKVLENVVATCLWKHMEDAGLTDMYQSAYRANHSTETALLKVQNDILCTMDRKEIVILTLLDMSAAFDLVDHEILLQRMHTRLSVTGTVLDWFRSYLSGRYQFVKIKDSSSKYESVPCGVLTGIGARPTPFHDIHTPSRRHISSARNQLPSLC